MELQTVRAARGDAGRFPHMAQYTSKISKTFSLVSADKTLIHIHSR